MMSTQHGIDGEVAAAVQLLAHSSSARIAPENGVVGGQLFSSSDSAPTKATCCDLNFTTSVTASTTAPSTSSRFGGELNGPTTQNVTQPLLTRNVDWGASGFAVEQSPTSSSANESTSSSPPYHKDRQSPSDSLASSRQHSPSLVPKSPELSQEEEMDIDSESENIGQPLEPTMCTSSKESDLRSDEVSKPELGNKPFRSGLFVACSDKPSPTQNDVERNFSKSSHSVREKSKSPRSPPVNNKSLSTPPPHRLTEAEAFIESVINSPSPSTKDGSSEKIITNGHSSKSPVLVTPEAEAMKANPSILPTQMHTRMPSQSAREAQIWDGTHPDIEKSPQIKRVRRFSAVEEEQHDREIQNAELSRPVGEDPDNTSDHPQQSPDLITTPGVWSLRTGLESLGFLPMELDIDAKVASRIHLWADVSRNQIATVLPPSMETPLKVSLLCLPVDCVQAMQDNVPPEVDPNEWILTNYGDECMHRVERESGCVWPERGLCVEVNGKGASVLGGRAVHAPNLTVSLDISRFLRPGLNTIRLVQSQGLSNSIFVVFCREAHVEDLPSARANVAKGWNKESKALEKTREIARRVKDKIRSQGLNHANATLGLIPSNSVGASLEIV